MFLLLFACFFIAFCLLFVACLWYNAGEGGEKVRIGTPADAILPQYTGSGVMVKSIDENDDACCMCVGLSDDTYWFFGEDCIGRLPLRIVISDV